MNNSNKDFRGFMRENLYAQTLYSVSRITARINHHHILQPVVDAIRQVVPVDAIGVYVVSDDKRSVERFSLISGHREVILGQGHKIAIDDSLLARLAIENDKTIYKNLASDRDKHSLDKQLAIQAGVRSAAAVSFRETETMRGSIVFDSYVPYQYEVDHLPFFQQVAELIGTYLENQYLLHQALLTINRDVAQKEYLDLIAQLQGDMKWQLTDIALQADHLSNFLHPNIGLRRKLQTLNLQARDLLHEFRSTASQASTRHLTGTVLPNVLVSKLRQFEQQTGVQTRWGTAGIPLELPAFICETICDFLQEALHIGHNYLQARLIKAQLIWQQNGVMLEIEDDGNGFDADLTGMIDKLKVHFHRMSAKANQLGGTLKIHSISGWGTRLTLKLPATSIIQIEQKQLHDLHPKNDVPISVLLVQTDDDAYLSTLIGQSSAIKIAGAADDKEDVLFLLHRVYPDVILVGGNVTKAIILDLLTVLQTQASVPPVVILGKDRQEYAELAQSNVQFCNGKDLEFETLANMLFRFASGESIEKATTPVFVQDENEKDFVESLSEREQEILGLVSQGLSNQEIANQLVVQESTIRWHMHNVLQKLGAKSRTHAVRIALERGLFL